MLRDESVVEELYTTTFDRSFSWPFSGAAISATGSLQVQKSSQGVNLPRLACLLAVIAL